MVLSSKSKVNNGGLAKDLHHRKKSTSTDTQVEFRINHLNIGNTGLKEVKDLANAIRHCKKTDPERYRNVLDINVDELANDPNVDVMVLTAYFKGKIIGGCLAKIKLIHKDGFEIPVMQLKAATLSHDFNFIELGGLATVNMTDRPKGISLGLAMPIAMIHALINDGVANSKSVLGAFLRLVDNGGEHVIPNPMAANVLNRVAFKLNPAMAALLTDVMDKACKGRAFLEFDPELFKTLCQQDAIRSFIDCSQNRFMFDQETINSYFPDDLDYWDVEKAILLILDYCVSRGITNTA